MYTMYPIIQRTKTDSRRTSFLNQFFRKKLKLLGLIMHNGGVIKLFGEHNTTIILVKETTLF